MLGIEFLILSSLMCTWQIIFKLYPRFNIRYTQNSGIFWICVLDDFTVWDWLLRCS
jgi:hypothetical protein